MDREELGGGVRAAADGSLSVAKARRTETLLIPRPNELTTILDHVRYAVTQFRAAQLVFAHGTTDPLAEAAFMVCEALHLPPDRLDAFAGTQVTHEEQKEIFDLIETRIRTRKPAAYLMHKAYLRGIPFYVDERAIVPRSYLGEILDGELFAGEGASLIDDPHAVERVLDLCTRSRCLALLAALRFPNAAADAADVARASPAGAARETAPRGRRTTDM